jgi:hypothetical protein
MTVRTSGWPRFVPILIGVALVIGALTIRSVLGSPAAPVPAMAHGAAQAEATALGGQSEDAPLPADVQTELRGLPTGTVIVPCNASVHRLPEGVIPTRTLGWWSLHPGWHYLKHGYCADDPKAVPRPASIETLAP